MAPHLPFQKIKNEILGLKYDLSLAFVPPAQSKKINKKYKGKNKPADTLAFSLSKNSGEIIICLPEAKKQAKNFNMTYTGFIGFLFIHSLLHLKGMLHSSKMESMEKKLVKKYNLK